MSVIDAIIAKKLCGGGGSVPKPLAYDYMPEGYPKKSVQTTTLMEEQELAFALEDNAVYVAYPDKAPKIVEGQTYIVNWDGTEYDCVCVVFRATILALGNKSIFGGGDDSGEPFLYLSTGAFATRDTSASHTISVKTIAETVTPIANDFLPVASEDNYGAVKKSEVVTSYEFGVLAQHDRMVEAVTEFREGRASIMWDNRLVVYAEHDPATDKIAVRLAEEPYRLRTSTKDSNGLYNITTAVSKYDGELILSSSTTDSTKNFRITVDDSGTISATEVPSNEGT